MGPGPRISPHHSHPTNGVGPSNYDGVGPSDYEPDFPRSEFLGPELSGIEIIDSGVAEYGRRVKPEPKKKGGDPRRENLAGYAGEFKPHVKDYFFAKAAGHYLMEVSDKSVKVDFYGGDSSKPAKTFVLR